MSSRDRRNSQPSGSSNALKTFGHRLSTALRTRGPELAVADRRSVSPMPCNSRFHRLIARCQTIKAMAQQNNAEEPEIVSFPPKEGQLCFNYRLEKRLKGNNLCVVYVCHHISDPSTTYVAKIATQSEAKKLSKEIECYKEFGYGPGIPRLLFAKRLITLTLHSCSIEISHSDGFRKKERNGRKPDSQCWSSKNWSRLSRKLQNAS